MENEETLKTTAVIGHAADLVEHLINKLLADSVVTAGIVVGGVLLSGNHVLGVEEATVGTSANLIDDVGLEIAVDCPGNIFAISCLGIHPSAGPKYMRAHIIKGPKYAPVSEKKVLKPWSGSAALRSSVRYPSG